MRKLKILYLILIMGMLTACGVKEDNSNTANTANTKEEPLGFTIPSAILEAKVSMGDDVLYYVPNENIESGFMQNLTSFHGNFLLYGFSEQEWEEPSEDTEFYLRLISPATGEVEAETSLLDMELPNVRECGEYLVITDWGNGNILFLNDKLQQVDNYQVLCEYNSMYMSNDGKKVYVFMPNDGLQITDLTSGEMEVSLENTANLFACNESENVVTFSYTNRQTLMDEWGALNLETGEILAFPFEGAFYNVSCANDTWMATQMEDSVIQYIGNSDEIKTFELKDLFGSIKMLPENKQILSKQYDENGFLGMSLYNMDGKFISKYENSVRGAEVQEAMVWSDADEGFFFIMSDNLEIDKLMFWDLSKKIGGEDLPMQTFSGEQLPEEAVAIELYERAKVIGEKYGVEIRIAEQLDKDYNDYKVEQMLDEYQIELALDVLDRGLSIYPEGYLKQLLYGSIYEIEIHLTGTLENLEQHNVDANGFTSYAGFVQERSGRSVMVLDVNEGTNLETYLHHELFHLTENKLSFDAGIRKESKYSDEEWMKLNPEGFEYAGSTLVLPDGIYNAEYDEWFIDIYSRTTPREDRARIMEYAVIGDYNMFILAPYRQAKLEYLNTCIRDAFDTTGWPDKTVWEETLEQSHMYD